MTTLIGILDRNWWGSRTDVNVVVNPRDKSLTWIPRDMYIPSMKNRINSIFFAGGSHKEYCMAATELGYPAEYSITILPSATIKALSDVCITVPVPYKMKFRYPLKPVSDIHLGEKIIEFNPPEETLSGERIHQWLGARYWIGPYRPPIQDFYRILRQQAFVKRLLEEKFDFKLIASEGINASDPKAFEDLSLVAPDWTFKILDEAKSQLVDGMAVLVKTPRFRYSYYQYPNVSKLTPKPKSRSTFRPRTSKSPQRPVSPPIFRPKTTPIPRPQQIPKPPRPTQRPTQLPIFKPQPIPRSSQPKLPPNQQPKRKS